MVFSDFLVWSARRAFKIREGIVEWINEFGKTMYGKNKLLNNLQRPIKKLFPPLRSVWKEQGFPEKRFSRRKWFSLPMLPSLAEAMEYWYFVQRSIKKISLQNFICT